MLGFSRGQSHWIARFSLPRLWTGLRRSVHSLPNSTKDMVVTTRGAGPGGIQRFSGPQMYDQDPIRKRVTPWLGIGAGLAALSLFAVLSTRDYSEKQALFRTTQSLRNLRKQAEDAVAPAQTEVRQVVFADRVKLDCVISTPASRKPGSPVVVLPAPFGETSQELALLQKQLAENGVKSVAFHRTDTLNKPQKPFTSPSLVARIAALNAVFIGCSIDAPVIIVTTGSDVWPAICLAGMRPGDIRGIVAVQPEMFHRNRDLSWVTAVAESSKKPHNPAALQELMKPPKVDDGTISAAITQLPEAAKAFESTQRIGSMLRMTPPKITDTGDAYYQEKMGTEPVLSSMEIDLLKLYAPHVTCPVVSVMPHSAAIPEGFSLSRTDTTRVSVLNAGLLVGGVLTQSYWDKLERGSDTTASPSRAAVKGVVDKFVSGLSALPAVVQQRVFGSQHDRWDAAIVTVCQSTAPNFLPVFVTGHDLILLTLQAPKALAAVVDRITADAANSEDVRPLTLDTHGNVVKQRKSP